MKSDKNFNFHFTLSRFISLNMVQRLIIITFLKAYQRQENQQYRRGISQFEAPLGNISDIVEVRGQVAHLLQVQRFIRYTIPFCNRKGHQIDIEFLFRSRAVNNFGSSLCIKTFLQERTGNEASSIVLRGKKTTFAYRKERERVTVVCNMRVNRAELKIRYLNNNLKLFVSIDMTV